MSYKKPFLLLMILLLLFNGVIFFQRQQIHKLTEERNTYQNNTYSLLSDMEVLKNDTAMKAYQVQTLNLSLDEYKKYRAADAKTIEDLRIKLKQVTAIAQQEMEINASIKTIVKDSVVHDTIPHIIQAMSFANEHISFVGKIEKDSLTANINVPIRLSQVLYKVPKHKFLWWSWGCKAVKQVIVTDNPYVHINYSEYIEVK